MLGRGLVVLTDEAVTDRCVADEHLVRAVDISDPQRPHVVSVCPPPAGDFCEGGLRFGPHNTHENRPGSDQSDALVFVTYWGAGLRVADAAAPVEVAHWIPPAPDGQEAIQIDDVDVAGDLTISVTDRVGGGVYVVRPQPDLADLMRERAR